MLCTKHRIPKDLIHLVCNLIIPYNKRGWVGGDVWRWLCSQKISAHVDGGPSRGSSMRRPGSEDPPLAWEELHMFFIMLIIYSPCLACNSSAHWSSILAKSSCQGRELRMQRAVSQWGEYLQNPNVHWASKLVKTKEKCWTSVMGVGQGKVNWGTDFNLSVSLSL